MRIAMSGVGLLGVVLLWGCAGSRPAAPEPARAQAPVAVPAAKQDPRQLAVVLQARAELPAAEAILAAHRELAGASEAPLQLKQERLEGKEGALAHRFSLGEGGELSVLMLPRPVAGGEAVEAVRHSLTGLLREWKLGAYEAQLVVVFVDAPGRSARDTQVRFTRLVGAVTRAASAPVGVYWGSANATHDPEFVRKVAGDEDLKNLAILWLGFVVTDASPERVRVQSVGMEVLGLPEMQLTAPKTRRPPEVLAALYDPLLHVLRRGAELPEGDTFGMSADERTPVRYGPSAEDPARRVWRVDLP
jgi:hypothetical protein